MLVELDIHCAPRHVQINRYYHIISFILSYYYNINIITEESNINRGIQVFFSAKMKVIIKKIPI